MHRRKPTRAETLIERIYRDETGYKMPRLIKRILLRKPTPNANPARGVHLLYRKSGYEC